MASTRPLASLSSKKSFAELSELGKRKSSANLSILYRTSSGREIKIAFAIGKKVGKAVVRNKVKRRLKSVVRELSDGIPGGEYLVIAKPGISAKSFAELRGELRAILPVRGAE